MNRNLIRIISLAFAALAVMPASAFFTPDTPVLVEEYRNDITGHYFLVAEPAEKQALDSGAAGPGWHPTGYVLGAYEERPGHFSFKFRVCRFYAPGPNSHFFTASGIECDLLVAHPQLGWISEGVHFLVNGAPQGVCLEGQVPVYRFYNNRFAFNDSAHRYVADGAVLNEMRASSWIEEGVAWCTTYADYVRH